MIQINIVSRISEDKNSFFDIIYLLHKLRETNVNNISLLFIGDIISNTLYQGMLKLVNLFDLHENVSFTGNSIRFADLTEEVKKGYFLNFTIGNFMGYSGIESINMGFKTIFYNVEKNLAVKTIASISQCIDLTNLLKLVSEIYRNKAVIDSQIIEDNLRMKKDFILSGEDKSYLWSVLSPS